MNKFFACLILQLFFLGNICFATPNAELQNTLKIGLILPLSGDWAFLGQGIYNAAMLAGEELSKHGVATEIVAEDNQGELTRSVAAAKKLIEVNKVNALISIISGVGQVVNPVAEQAKIVHIGICSNTAVAAGSYNFINYLTAKKAVQKYLSELEFRYPKGAQLSIFSMNEAGFELIINELKRQSKDSKLSIVSQEVFETKTNDFKAQILRASQKKSSLILLLGIAPEIEILAKQLKELGQKQELSSIESFGLVENFSLFEGQWFIDAALPNQEFQNRYKKRFGQEVTVGCGHAYDTVQIIGQAFKESGSTEDLSEELEKVTKYSGVIGDYKFSFNGVLETEPSVKIIKDGRIVKLR